MSVIDFSIGGLLVEALEPFTIGATTHLYLAASNGRLNGAFVLRCLHAHRTIADDRVTYLSAFVFAHPLDDATRDALIQAGRANHDDPAPAPRRTLRLAVGPAD